EHALGDGTPGARRGEPVAGGALQERVARRAAPEQEGEARRELVLAELEDARFRLRRAELEAVEELRILQHAAQDELDARVKVVGDVGVVLGRERLER